MIESRNCMTCFHILPIEIAKITPNPPERLSPQIREIKYPRNKVLKRCIHIF